MSPYLGACWTAAAVAVAVGCHDAPSARARVLAQMPASARTIGVADGAALASPDVKKAVDAVRQIVPATLGCVIDAALASDAIAVAEAPAGVVVVMVGPATKCAALSQVSPGLWMATVGTPPAADRAATVLADSRWDRARTYLVSSPIALAVDLGGLHIVAAAQPDPLSAWLTIDGADPGQVPADKVRRFLETWKGTPLESKLAVTLVDRQLVVRAKTLADTELASLTREVLASLLAPEPTAQASFTCPPIADNVVSCSGTRLAVRSIAAHLRELAAHLDQPAVSGGDLIGVRIASDISGLRHGDILLGIDATRVTSPREVEALAKLAPARVAIAVRRGTSDLVLDVRQQE